MAHSGRERHRDREPGRKLGDEEPIGTDRVFRMTDVQRQLVAKYLRVVDEARRTLERQHNAENRTLIRALKTSADAIFDVINELDEL
jgi:hypothetical protein